MTHTYATCDIVILCDSGALRIYAQDFSIATPGKLPEAVGQHLDPNHVRTFISMRDFTEWLHEVGAIVDRCFCS